MTIPRLGIGLAVSSVLALAACAGGAPPPMQDQEHVLSRPDVTKSMMAAADKAEKQNDPSSAVSYYRGIFNREPTNVEAAIGLMQALRLLGLYDQARDVSSRALAARPDEPSIVGETGKVELAAGRLTEASTLLTKATKLNPRDWKSFSALGVVYDRQGDYEHAKESYQAALKLAPDSVAIMNNFGLSLAMAGDLQSALSMLQQAAAQPSADARVRQNLALVYALSGDMPHAEELTRRDLPPEQAKETLAYYRELAASHAQKQ
ncbi:MAG TPA: tetratricopeptide repeat protein [Candidatus Cybelea sp.]|nr:tetratricopeptide repeat protein [Candidatus Cybelea sp.]